MCNKTDCPNPKPGAEQKDCGAEGTISKEQYLADRVTELDTMLEQSYGTNKALAAENTVLRNELRFYKRLHLIESGMRSEDIERLLQSDGYLTSGAGIMAAAQTTLRRF